jgi:hypothetical protein
VDLEDIVAKWNTGSVVTKKNSDYSQLEQRELFADFRTGKIDLVGSTSVPAPGT